MWLQCALQRVILHNYLCKKPPDSVKAVVRKVALKVVLVSLLFELFCPLPVTRKCKPLMYGIREWIDATVRDKPYR